jgi:hypothetical protein
MDQPPDVMLDHRIQQRAYEIHQSKANGSPLEDWLQAERQILQEISYGRDGFRRATGTRKLTEGNRVGRELPRKRQIQRCR